MNNCNAETPTADLELITPEAKPDIHAQIKAELEGLFAARISQFFYLPFLDINHPPEAIIEMCEDIDDGNIETLAQRLPALRKVLTDTSIKRTKDMAVNALDHLIYNNSYPYFVAIDLCTNVRSVHINDAGEISGVGLSWNSYTQTWVLVSSLLEAVQFAKQHDQVHLRKIHKRLLEKAPLETE